METRGVSASLGVRMGYAPDGDGASPGLQGATSGRSRRRAAEQPALVLEHYDARVTRMDGGCHVRPIHPSTDETGSSSRSRAGLGSCSRARPPPGSGWSCACTWPTSTCPPAGAEYQASGKWLFGGRQPDPGARQRRDRERGHPGLVCIVPADHRPAEREPVRDARGARRDGDRAGPARRPADRDPRASRPCSSSGNFVLAGTLGSNPALIVLGALLALASAECRLDRPRSMVHPVGASDVLRVAAGRQRVDAGVGLIAAARTTARGWPRSRTAIVARWMARPSRGPASGGTRSAATAAAAASTPTATRRTATASRGRKAPECAVAHVRQLRPPDQLSSHEAPVPADRLGGLEVGGHRWGPRRSTRRGDKETSEAPTRWKRRRRPSVGAALVSA